MCVKMINDERLKGSKDEGDIRIFYGFRKYFLLTKF